MVPFTCFDFLKCRNIRFTENFKNISWSNFLDNICCECSLYIAFSIRRWRKWQRELASVRLEINLILWTVCGEKLEHILYLRKFSAAWWDHLVRLCFWVADKKKFLYKVVCMWSVVDDSTFLFHIIVDNSWHFIVYGKIAGGFVSAACPYGIVYFVPLFTWAYFIENICSAMFMQ